MSALLPAGPVVQRRWVRMRAWWTSLGSTPRAILAAGVGAVVVAVVVVLVTVTGSDDGPTAAGTPPGASASASPGAGGPGANGDDPASGDAPQAVTPPDKDEYCPAYEAIRTSGLQPQNGDDSDQVDLTRLGRTFDRLVARYTAAERVSPLSLRDDYAQALLYLKQGQQAVSSEDVDLLKALVANLDSLNASISAIQAKSATFCG